MGVAAEGLSVYHVYPVGFGGEPEHEVDGDQCWCYPRTEAVFDGTILKGYVVIHERPN